MLNTLLIYFVIYLLDTATLTFISLFLRLINYTFERNTRFIWINCRLIINLADYVQEENLNATLSTALSVILQGRFIRSDVSAMIIALHRYLIFSVFQNSISWKRNYLFRHIDLSIQARTIYVIFWVYRVNFQSWVFQMFVQKENPNFILRLQF